MERNGMCHSTNLTSRNDEERTQVAMRTSQSINSVYPPETENHTAVPHHNFDCNARIYGLCHNRPGLSETSSRHKQPKNAPNGLATVSHTPQNGIDAFLRRAGGLGRITGGASTLKERSPITAAQIGTTSSSCSSSTATSLLQTPTELHQGVDDISKGGCDDLLHRHQLERDHVDRMMKSLLMAREEHEEEIQRLQEIEKQRAALHDQKHQGKQQQDIHQASPRAPGQWHICQHCQARAFASIGDTKEHEAVCPSSKQRKEVCGVHESDSTHQLERSSTTTTTTAENFNHRQHVRGTDGNPLPRRLQGSTSYPHTGLHHDLDNHLDVVNTSPSKSFPAPHQTKHIFPGANVNGVRGFSGDTLNYLPPTAKHIVAIPLSTTRDRALGMSPFHCFIRRHCVEVFASEANDGIVCLRCPYCNTVDDTSRSQMTTSYPRSFIYPTSLADIYSCTEMLLRDHVATICPNVPLVVTRCYRELESKPGASGGCSLDDWIEAAKMLRLEDSGDGRGVRFATDRKPQPASASSQSLILSQFATKGPYYEERKNVPLVKKEYPGTLQINHDYKSSPRQLTSDASIGAMRSHNNTCLKQLTPIFPKAHVGEFATSRDSPTTLQESNLDPEAYSVTDTFIHPTPPGSTLVLPCDSSTATSFSYYLLSQMRRCSFTESDRLGKRKGLPVGFAGLACRHCYGGFGAGRFFPSTLKTLSDTSKTLNVLHNHMMKCRKCPLQVRNILDRLREKHDEERARMKFGSQKAFFARIWERLHERKQEEVDNAKPVITMPSPKRDTPDKNFDESPTKIDGFAALSAAAFHMFLRDGDGGMSQSTTAKTQVASSPQVESGVKRKAKDMCDSGEQEENEHVNKMSAPLSRKPQGSK